MFTDLDCQVSKIFLVRRCKAGGAVGQGAGQSLTADADMGTVVGQTYIGEIR